MNTLTRTVEEGRWMSPQEIKSLGRGRWSDTELMELLEWGTSPLPSREQEGIKQYFVPDNSLGTFLPYHQ